MDHFVRHGPQRKVAESRHAAGAHDDRLAFQPPGGAGDRSCNVFVDEDVNCVLHASLLQALSRSDTPFSEVVAAVSRV